VSDLASTEIAAALLQGTITLGLALLFFFLHRRYRRPHFRWWGVAFLLYSARIASIITFLATGAWAWLYWHQVATGWTALALLWAALVFSHQLAWRPAYGIALIFPVAWSWVAIFQLSNFLLAAAPAVLFLGATTIWTGLVFRRYRRQTASAAAGALSWGFLLWGLHHLDYPLLRARGAWNPWGYYLDLLFVLGVGAGVLLLVIEELRGAARTLTALSGDLRSRGGKNFLETLLGRVLSLPGVRGAALVAAGRGEVSLLHGVGECVEWRAGMPVPVRQRAETVARTGVPSLGGDRSFTGVLPVRREPEPLLLVATADATSPFAALDAGILVAVGEQIGAAVDTLDLAERLRIRSADLERLSGRMMQQYEEQRQRLARELHDETAQVFAALKLQLGALGEVVPDSLTPSVDRLLSLVGVGSQSIRQVVDDLRPAVLDDLGLLPALRAIVSRFPQWSGVSARITAPDRLPDVSEDMELALFRAAQEALSNVARHARATEVLTELRTEAGRIVLTVIDDGVGMPAERLDDIITQPGRAGLYGLRERLAGLGGSLTLAQHDPRGLRVRVEVPVGDHP
jgi:signal transduction histidine kinase